MLRNHLGQSRGRKREGVYCGWLCPLGAGLAIPAKLKVFDWLKRRPQCGRECRLCETKSTVGAIDPLGRIRSSWTPAWRCPCDLDLQDRALATSSPLGTRIGAGASHILHPKGLQPRWQTVSICAPLGAVADALSTAACLLDRPAIDAALAAFPGARLEHLF